jgi:hypothetical protein
MASTSSTSKRRRGAPPGNQNARKHGFYSAQNPTLTQSEKNPYLSISSLRSASSANPCSAFLLLANPIPFAKLSTTCAPSAWLPWRSRAWCVPIATSIRPSTRATSLLMKSRRPLKNSMRRSSPSKRPNLYLATTDKPQMRALKTETHPLNSNFQFSQFGTQLFLFVFFRNNSIQTITSSFGCQLTIRGENGSEVQDPSG